MPDNLHLVTVTSVVTKTFYVPADSARDALLPIHVMQANYPYAERTENRGVSNVVPAHCSFGALTPTPCKATPVWISTFHGVPNMCFCEEHGRDLATHEPTPGHQLVKLADWYKTFLPR